MLKQRRQIAEQLADRLFAAKSAIDTALAQTAGLAALMPAVRADARVSTLIGQDAIERAIEAVNALGQARRSICETHKELSVAQRQVGLGAVAFGGLVDKPEGSASLAPVANRAA